MAEGFTGKIIIVTGGAISLTKKIVERFHSQGAKVIIWDKDLDLIRSSISLKDQTFFSSVDITDYPSVESAAKKVNEEFGQIDILINNAAVSRFATLLQTPAEEWQQEINSSLTGVFNCTKAIAPYMVGKGSGRIIYTSSFPSIFQSSSPNNFDATQSGIVGITKVWARELGRYGITVNAVSPGFIQLDKAADKDQLKSIKEKIPAGRIGTSDDIVNAYLFLASDASSYINGTILQVDGGYQ